VQKSAFFLPVALHLLPVVFNGLIRLQIGQAVTAIFCRPPKFEWRASDGANAASDF
jgi:hypothetical protein